MNEAVMISSTAPGSHTESQAGGHRAHKQNKTETHGERLHARVCVAVHWTHK